LALTYHTIAGWEYGGRRYLVHLEDGPYSLIVDCTDGRTVVLSGTPDTSFWLLASSEDRSREAERLLNGVVTDRYCGTNGG